MADQAVTNEVDSSKPARKCAWCGVDISKRHGGAKFCSDPCVNRASHARHRSRRGFAALEGRCCKYCESLFNANHERQVYCSGMCRNRAQYHRRFAADPDKVRSENAKWRANNAAKRAAYMAQLRRDNPEHHLAMQRKWTMANRDKVRERARNRYWEDPDKFKARQNERDRRRGAERALAMLLMPVHKLEAK